MQEFELFEPAPTKDAVVIAAFPTAGSAAPIAAQYLIRHLGLPVVGHMRLPELSQLTAIQDGRAMSPVQIHGGQVMCKVGKTCPTLYVVSSDVVLPGPVVSRVVQTLLSFAEDAHLLLMLEAVVRSAEDEVADVFVASARGDVLKDLTSAGLTKMPRAVLAGITAQVLLASDKARSGALVVEADPQHPDGHAAAALLEGIARIVPDMVLDPKPLREEADALEREIHAAQRAAQSATHTSSSSFI